MFSTELRSTLFQELGAALRDRVNSKLTELAKDNTLAHTIREEAQRYLDMLTVSYDCVIFNPSTGTREMVVPAVVLLVDDQGDVNTPLLAVMVNFSSKPNDQAAARLLDLYPYTTIIRVDIPYVKPKARVAAADAGNTASSYSCWYDIIIRASTLAANGDKKLASSSSSSTSANRLHFLLRKRLLPQQKSEDEGKYLEIPLVFILPELAWRISLAHPAAAAAGLLSIKLPYASLRKSLAIAAVRQKNVDKLRLKSSTGAKQPPSSTLPSGGVCLQPSHGLHTFVSPSTYAPTFTRTRAFDGLGNGCSDDLVAILYGHGHIKGFSRFGGRVSGAVPAVGGIGRPNRNVANLGSLLGFGWRLARRGRF